MYVGFVEYTSITDLEGLSLKVFSQGNNVGVDSRDIVCHSVAC